MFHPNKNKILALYSNEISGREKKKLQAHLQTCKNCAAYLETLNRIEQTLALYADEEPEPNTINPVRAKIIANSNRTVQVFEKPEVAVAPILQIAFSVGALFSLFYFLHDKLQLLPFWQTIEHFRIVQTIGSFGVLLVLFFCISSFLTLAFTPILILEKLNNLKNSYATKTQRHEGKKF